MYDRLRLLLTAVVLAWLSLHALSAAGQREANDTHAKIPDVYVASFGEARVIGLLGHPLGTVVRVSGTVVDGDELRTKASRGRTYLRIESVNGKQLESSVMLPFGRASKIVESPKPGETFDYLVHEYGAFDGHVDVPREFGGKPDMTIAHDGFHYRPQLTVHKALESPKK